MKKPSKTLLDTVNSKLDQLYTDIRRLELIALTYEIKLNGRAYKNMAEIIEIEKRVLNEHSRADS